MGASETPHGSGAAPIVKSRCKHCGEPLDRLMLLALLQDLGAKVYPSATHCTKKRKHDFSVPDSLSAAKAPTRTPEGA